MKIKYRNETFYISNKYCLTAIQCRIKLLLRRIWRWKSLVNWYDLIIFISLSMVWCGVGYLLSILNHTSFFAIISEIRIEYISSVIIMGCAGGLIRVSKYRKINKDQHWLYRNLMDAFCDIFDCVIGINGLYISLYCDRTVDQTRASLQKKRDVDLPETEIRFFAKLTLKKLSMLEQYNMSGRLNVEDFEMLDLEVYNCEMLIERILEMEKASLKMELDKLLIEAQILLDDLRFVWRRDNDIHQKIWDVIMKSGYTLQDDFYVRMYLYDYEQIKEYKNKKAISFGMD